MNKVTKMTVLLAFVVLGSVACSSAYKAPQVGEELIWTNDGEEKRPGWTATSVAIKSGGEVVEFVGYSNRHSTQRGARDAALTDVRRAIAQHAETVVNDIATTTEAGGTVQDGIQNPVINRKVETTEIASLAVTRMNPEEWRFEQWKETGSNRTFYVAFVKANVSERIFEAGEG